MQLPIEMYHNYVLRRADDYKALEQALQNQDATTFKRIGHQIKGNASSFGFDDLVPIGMRLNQIDANNLQNEGKTILDDLKKWIEAKRQSLNI